ncbi:MAG: hypothetical protein H0X67_06940 [Acidobacteria bacterium]|nr:hypothetical protein [Acidobacteriota bacterium]
MQNADTIVSLVEKPAAGDGQAARHVRGSQDPVDGSWQEAQQAHSQFAWVVEAGRGQLEARRGGAGAPKAA